MAKKRLGIDALFQTSVPTAEAPPPQPPSAPSAPTTDLSDVAAAADEATGEFRRVALDELRPGTSQPRHHFDAAALEQLAESIRAHGVLQPLLVREREGEPGLEIIAGERRWRAARLAGIDEVPARIVAFDDDQALAAAITENLQREDLSALDEAEGYIELLKARLEANPDFASFRESPDGRAEALRLLRTLNNVDSGRRKDNVVLTSLEGFVDEIFGSIGRIGWKGFVSHRLPLLNLPPELVAAMRERQLPYTKARAIARVTADKAGGDEAARALRESLIERAIAEKLSVRAIQVEVAAAIGVDDEMPPTTGIPRKTKRRPGLSGRVDELRERLDGFDETELGPARVVEVAAAVEALLKLL